MDTRYLGLALALGSGFGLMLGSVLGVLIGDVGFWIAMGISMGAGIGLAIGAGLAAQGPSRATDSCPRCGYSLQGLQEPTCPECGTACPDAGSSNS
ncbi:MAG: hypothetical protein AAFX79_06575 [Planctomycetota bacterium]